MEVNCVLLALATIGVYSFFFSINCCCYSVIMLCLCDTLFFESWLFETPWTAARQAPLSFTISRLCSNSYPLSRWCYLTISSSATHFSFFLQSFPASGSLLMSRLSSSGGQSIGASASTSVLPMNIQGLFPLGLTGLNAFPLMNSYFYS